MVNIVLEAVTVINTFKYTNLIQYRQRAFTVILVKI